MGDDWHKVSVARVFPRRTRATPTDELAFVGRAPLVTPRVEVVHVSVTFSWDLKEAQHCAESWARVAPTTIGGPATGEPGGEFTPGRYLAPGYVITSRGCPNRCWFCDVWKREGGVCELPIVDGFNILDDNLLACSESHVRAVFSMLSKHRGRAQFTGGLEAARLKRWHAEAIRELRPAQVFFAYDTPAGWEPLCDAVSTMRAAGHSIAGHRIRAYVLCGYPRDTEELAAERMERCLSIGVTPMAMLWRDKSGRAVPSWRRFQRRWARPAIIHQRNAEALPRQVPLFGANSVRATGAEREAR